MSSAVNLSTLAPGSLVSLTLASAADPVWIWTDFDDVEVVADAAGNPLCPSILASLVRGLPVLASVPTPPAQRRTLDPFTTRRLRALGERLGARPWTRLVVGQAEVCLTPAHVVHVDAQRTPPHAPPGARVLAFPR